MLALHQVFKWLHYESDYQKWAAPLLGVLHNKTEEWAEKEFFYGLSDAIRTTNRLQCTSAIWIHYIDYDVIQTYHQVIGIHFHSMPDCYKM
jgi:hypothetical protein